MIIFSEVATDLLFSSSPADVALPIPLGLAAAELVAMLDDPRWPLVASNSRLLRLRLEEAAIPPPPPMGAVAAMKPVNLAAARTQPVKSATIDMEQGH